MAQDIKTLKETRSLLNEIKSTLTDVNEGYKNINRSQKKGLQDYEKILESLIKSGELDRRNIAKRGDLIKQLVDGNVDLTNIASKRAEIQKKMDRAATRGWKKAEKGYKVDLDILDSAESRLKTQELTEASLSAADDLTGGMASKAKEFVNVMKANPLIAILTISVAILKSFSDNLDKIGEKFGAIGVKDFSQDLMAADAEMAKLGYDTGTAADMAEKLSSEFGIGFKEAIKLTPEIADMSKALGMSTDEGTALIGILGEISNLSAEESIELAKQTELLAKANGVAPGAVMRDIAASSETMAKFTMDGGKNIMRAAIQAKKLGTSLDKVAGIMDSMLDLQSSIEAEMNASVMIGRQLNYQKARELALNNDIVGAMSEIVSQLGSEEEFNKLNALQRKALADSIGVGVDELAKFVGKEKESVTLAGELGKQPGFEELVGKEALSSMAQTLGTLKSIGAELVNVIGPILNVIVDAVNLILIPFIFIADLVGKVTGAFANWANQLGPVSYLLKGIAYVMVLLAGYGAYAALSMIPVVGPVLGAIAAAAIIGKGFGAISKAGDMISPAKGKTQVSTKEGGLFEMSKNDDLVAGPGIAGTGGGVNIQPVVEAIGSLNIQLESLKSENIQLRTDMKSYFGFGGTVATKVGRETVKGIERATLAT